jgi:4-hydroxy-3-methylbut-2-enyl diphosphate reductase
LKVIVARTAGFCWGVKRAMDAVLDASNEAARGGKAARPVQTLGPLIHNPQSLELIGKRGVAVAASPEEVGNGTVVIRAHGIPIQDLRGLKQRQEKGEVKIVNATCPEVAKVHSKIKKWSPKGYFTLILGSHGHAESVAHRSFAESGSLIIASMAEAQALTDAQLKRILVVAQTTFTVKDYREISLYLQSRAQDCILENTICEDTWTRQDEATQLAQLVDAVVVVGGKASSNTKHLAELAESYGKPVQYVETAAELDLSRFSGRETVGVLAGASTPTWLVDEVMDVLEQVGDGPGKFTRFMTSAFATPLLFSVGAAVMTFGVDAWAGLGLNLRYSLITGTFVLAMFLLNPYLDPMGLGTKGPGQARFLERNRRVLVTTALLANLFSLAAAASMGWKAFAVVAGASLLGATYRRGLFARGQRFSLAAIPGSKDILVAGALGIVAVAMPVWQDGAPWSPRAWAALVLVTGLGFARTVIYDIRDMQNDQVLGRETLPIVIGKRRAKAVMVILMALLGIFAVGATLLESRAHAGLIAGVFGLALFYPLFYLWYYHERFTTGRPRFELKPEVSFYLLGLLALV